MAKVRRLLRGILPTRMAAIAAAAALAAAGCAQFPPRLQLPPRGPTALTGTQIATEIQGLSVAAREQFLWRELTAGNVPEHLRQLVPVTTTRTIQGQPRTAVFWCTPDYIGIGSDTDWFRMPMSPELAQQLCDSCDGALPTRRMADAVWSAAAAKLAPSPISPSAFNITSPTVFWQHHLTVEGQLQGAPPSFQRGDLVAGIKKDVVASALIRTFPGRVCIYGWHRTSGTPIQPLSKVHTSTYMDYSHGVRLVAARVEVDGVPMAVAEVLADPVLHPLLSDEGPFTSHRYPAASLEGFPVVEAFPAGGPERTEWRAKFRAPTTVTATLPPPSGDATVLRIMDPAGGTDSLRIDTGSVRNVIFQADLLCEHRPQLSADGFERIGIFVRDQAQGAFDGTQSQQGACYALTWDSHTGRVQCLSVRGGVLTDLLASPRFVTGDAWRRFRIRAEGDQLRFHLDGELLLRITDTTHPEGAFGIGYHEYFQTNSNMRGTRVDACHGDVLGGFQMGLTPGLARGSIELKRRRGIPGDVYFTGVSIPRGRFPMGPFFGLDATQAELNWQLGTGHPAFVGTFGTDGIADLTVPGLPLGLTLHAVTVMVDPSFRLVRATEPVAVTVR